MIGIYYKGARAKTVQKLTEFKQNSWIHVQAPTDEDLALLSSKFYIEPDLLVDAVDPYEVPRIEIEDGVVYIFLRYIAPVDDAFVTAPLMIAIRDNYLITVSPKPFPILEKFLTGRIEFSSSNRTMLLAQLLQEITVSYKQHLNRVSKRISAFGRGVEKITNSDIIEFVRFENVLYELNSALVRMDNIYVRLMTGKLVKYTEDEFDLIEDVSLETGQLIQISKDAIRNIVNIREAYSTIMTNNLNHVVTIFTSLTVILTIPTIIGSFFGMNVPIPGTTWQWAFPVIVGVTLLVTIAALIFFIRKNWL